MKKCFIYLYVLSQMSVSFHEPGVPRKHTLCALRRPVFVLAGPLGQHWAIICLGRWSPGYSFNKLVGRMQRVLHQLFEIIMYMLPNRLEVLLGKIGKCFAFLEENNAMCEAVAMWVSLCCWCLSCSTQTGARTQGERSCGHAAALLTYHGIVSVLESLSR